MVAHEVIALSGFFLVFLFEPRHGPCVEFRRYFNTLNLLGNLPLQLFYFDAWLATGTALLGAVVVGVVVDITVFLVLLFVLGCDAASTLSTEHHAGVGKAVSAWSGDSFPAEDRQNLLVFFFGDHRRMFALMPVTASFRIFKDATIKRIGEYTVEGAPCHRFAVLHTEAPLVFGDACRFHGIALFVHYHLKELTQLVKALLVFLDDLHAFGPVGCVEVAHRCRARIPPHLHFSTQSALYIHTFGVVFKLRLTAKQVQQEFIIGRVGERLPGHFHFFEFADVEKVNNVSGVHRVS